MKLYLDTTILAALTYFKDKDAKRYSECNWLIRKCNENESTIVISFYSIHEPFLLPFEYEDEKTARKTGLALIKEILNINRIELIELLSREKRIIYQNMFSMSDRTDIPHAISAGGDPIHYRYLQPYHCRERLKGRYFLRRAEYPKTRL